MGSKRSFDEDDLQELSFKHPKQLDSRENLTSQSEINAPYTDSEKGKTPGEAVDTLYKPQMLKGSKDDINSIMTDFNGKECGTSAPVSWGTSSIMEDDAGSMAVLQSSYFPNYFEFDYPRHNLIQYEDAYSSLLNSALRKEVPVGPDHQADLPVWNPDYVKHHSSSPTLGGFDDNGEERKGFCVMPMPDLDNLVDDDRVTDRGLGCSCLDGSSIGCVQQHVKEVREHLKEVIGLEKFVELGFFEMGEEVAHNWTEEEEQLFHEVVYSNPVSHGENFWVHLSAVFPSRTKQELVSYYFNVFMLRKRAAQNRSRWLEIDSDDDEWKGHGRGPFAVTDDDSEVFINQDVRVDHGTDSPSKYGDEDDDDDASDSDGDDDGDGDASLQVDVGDATKNDVGKYQMSNGKTDDLLVDHEFDLMDKSLGNAREFSDVQEDSCTSFEGQPYVAGSYFPVAERAGLLESKVNSSHEKLLHSNTERFGPQYALESSDAETWDATYSMSPMKSVDLLPTCNMIEEIFGTCTWSSKSSNGKSIS